MSQDKISISNLNLILKNWKVVATVRSLSDIKMGPTGKYFYVDLFDSTGEIRALAYNSEAVRLYNQFEVNSVYLIENGKIQIANKKYKWLNNDFEIIFNEYTRVTEKDLSDASQSQHNELLGNHIDKRLKEIEKEELVLAMERLGLKYQKEKQDLEKKINDSK